MDETQNNLAEILTKCEANGTAPKFVIQKDSYKEQKTSLFTQQLPVRTKPVIYNTNGEEIFVVSDLHIAAGRNYAGVYKGTENFFADDSFSRFLLYANAIKKTKNAILVINGDIFDFLRVTDFPGKVKRVRISKRIKYLLKFQPLKKTAEPSKQVVNDEYDNWLNELNKLGIKKTKQELEQSISGKERKYGLQTDDYKTIYKFIKIRNGHPVFFSALSEWLEAGNKLIILKGNHDLEVYWLAVRNYLRLITAENIADKNSNGIEEILTKIVLPNITFIDDSVEIDKDFYVEHGHRYDKFCMILDSPVLENVPSQINIPFGSFFNRYLINRIELFYPFIDNVRPSGNVLPILLRDNFPLGLKILLHHIPILFGMFTKNFRYVKFMLNKVIWFILALLFPIIFILIFNWSEIYSIPNEISVIEKSSTIISILFDGAKNFLTLFLSYLLARIVSWFQLSEPSSLDKYARERFEGTDYRLSTMGHTHNPGEYIFNVDGKERRFYNTGTWIPVIETSTAEIREDKTYTFLHLKRYEEGKLQPAENGLIQRWNDDAGRAEKQILIERK
jgi:UDP-2,3-diacylglucosamine pyrophosphatase LpxH